MLFLTTVLAKHTSQQRVHISVGVALGCGRPPPPGPYIGYIRSNTDLNINDLKSLGKKREQPTHTSDFITYEFSIDM